MVNGQTCRSGSLSESGLHTLQAVRRRIQEEAAERRRQESENRGIKDPEKVRRQQQRAAQMEKDELEAAKHGAGNPSLKVAHPVRFDWCIRE